MRLGVNLMAHTASTIAPEAERLGFHTALAPEGLNDAISVLGLAAGRTERMVLVSGVCQIPARSPVLTAMTAATMHKLTDGRFRLGLGVSNALATRNWHGLRFDRPLARTREYVDVVRLALRGEEVRYAGEHHVLPLDDGEVAFRAAPAPVPIYLAAIGPHNQELVGEIADGWVGVFQSPGQVAEAMRRFATGWARAGRTPDGFEVLLTLPMAIGTDPERLAGPIRSYVARFLSLGHRRANFYFRLAEELGLGAAAARVQDLYAAGDPAAAAAAVPFEFIDATALIGTADRVVGRMTEYAAAGVTTLCVGAVAPTVDQQLSMLATARSALDDATSNAAP